MKLKDTPDRELISRLRASDSQAMEVLYDRYAGLVYSVAFKILQNNSDAEELTQDVFIRKTYRNNHPALVRLKVGGYREILGEGWMIIFL